MDDGTRRPSTNEPAGIRKTDRNCPAIPARRPHDSADIKDASRTRREDGWSNAASAGKGWQGNNGTSNFEIHINCKKLSSTRMQPQAQDDSNEIDCLAWVLKKRSVVISSTLHFFNSPWSAALLTSGHVGLVQDTIDCEGVCESSASEAACFRVPSGVGVKNDKNVVVSSTARKLKDGLQIQDT